MAEQQGYDYENDPSLVGPPVTATAAPQATDAAAVPSYESDPNLVGAPVAGQATDRGFWGNLNQDVGSFASGVNREGIATALGAPMDASAWLANQGIVAPINALTGQQTLSPITRPLGGSAQIGDLIASTVGETKPETLGQKILYGAGGALGQTAVGMGAGTALKGVGALPRVAEALIGGPELTTPTTISNLSVGAASGAGAAAGEAGADAAVGGDSPAARMVGGTLGGFAAGVPVGMLPAALRMGRDLLIRPFTSGGQDVIAGDTLLKAAGGQVPTLPSDTPLGLDYSLGQRTNNPGLIQFERSLEANAPSDVRGQFETDRSFNNQEVHKAMGEVGTAGDPAELSQQLAGTLDTAHQQARQDITDAYKAIPDATVPTQPLKDSFTDFVDGLTKVRRKFVPTDYEDILMGFDRNEPMREVMDLRSSLLSDERTARSNKDWNRASVLRDLDNALFQRIPEGGIPGVTTPNQAATLAYQNANQLNADFNATFNAGPMRKIFEGRGYDASVPDSAVAQKLLGAGQGQTERVAQFVKAAGMDPDAMQNARDWFSTQLANKVAGARQDAAGDAEILGNVMRKFVQDNQPLINSPIFSQRQRALISEIVDAVTMGERTARAGARGGSDTAINLAGGRYLDKVVGSWFAPILEKAGGAIGAGLGGAVTGGSTAGAIAGYGAGEAAAKAITQNNKVAAQIQNLLYDATRNPNNAIRLMQKASRANDPFVGNIVQRYTKYVPPAGQVSVRSLVPGVAGQRLPDQSQPPLSYSYGAR